MNLVRLGHYFVPTSTEGGEVSGYCQTAIVVYVDESPTRGIETVNLVVWDHDGDASARQNVMVEAPVANHGHASFHLGIDCPWKR